jgi:hypothetical protein
MHWPDALPVTLVLDTEWHPLQGSVHEMARVMDL